MVDPADAWDECDGIKIDFCRVCNGSGRDLSKPPCDECGAMTSEEAETKCNCAGDKDDCHGCKLWSDLDEPNTAEARHGAKDAASD